MYIWSCLIFAEADSHLLYLQQDIYLVTFDHRLRNLYSVLCFVDIVYRMPGESGLTTPWEFEYMIKPEAGLLAEKSIFILRKKKKTMAVFLLYLTRHLF